MHDDLEDIKSGGNKHPQSQTEIGAYESTDTGAASSVVNPFSEEGEKLFQSQEKEAENKQSNPFGVVPGRPSRPVSGFSQHPMLENGLVPLVERGALLSSRPTIIRSPLLIGGIGGVIALLVLAGIWYFLLGNKEKTPESASTATVIEKTSEVPGNVTSKQPPFSKDLPNYLSFNTEIVSPEDIRQILSQAANRIKEAGITEPIEFLITDQNNNPLAFSRFAFLLKLDLDPEIISLADEAFSLYAYNDAGHSRLGLVLTFKDTQAATALIEKTEAELPYALRALILEPNISVGRKLSFRSTGYNQFSVRFANIDSDQGISLDYSVNNNRLFVGTSKNTLREILDASTK